MAVNSFQNIVTTEKETSLSSYKDVEFFLLYMKITLRIRDQIFGKYSLNLISNPNASCKRYTPALRIGARVEDGK